MTFDYFNTSHLGFGSKITKAFLQLNRLLEEGEDNLQDLFAIYELYSQYIDKNYPAPFPTRPDAPVRAKELYDIVNDGNTLRAVYLDEDDELNVKVNLFKRISNRFTIAQGKTDLKKGFAFCRDSVSNKNFSRDIQFVENYDDGKGNFLFEFRIDADNNINIVGDSYKYYIPSNFDHITSMEKSETIFTNTDATGNASYTATDYECILIVGYMWPKEHPRPYNEQSHLEVIVNGETLAWIRGRFCRQYVVVYLKPGDVLKASCKTAFKIKYTSGESIPPQPDPPGPPEPAALLSKMQATYGMYSSQGVFYGTWNLYGSETDFSPSFETSQMFAGAGAATGALFTLDKTIPASDNYTLSFDYQGTYLNPFYGEVQRDKCNVYFLNDNDVTISSQSFTVTLPDTSSGGRTTTTVSDLAVPEGTYKIRIASMGYAYNSVQQRFTMECKLTNVSLLKN